MQRILRIDKKAAAVLMAALVFFACGQEDRIPEADSPTSEEVVQKNVTLTFVQDSGSLTQLHSFEGDAVSVTYALDGAWRSKFYKSDPQPASGIVEEFKVKTDLSTDQKGSLTFYGVYPQLLADADLSALPSIPATVPFMQNPSSTSWD